MVSIEAIKDNIDLLAKEYADPNSIIVMDPTARGHLRNQAISSGNAKLNNALNSVNRVFVDEIHLWTLERTAAVIGGDNKPPSELTVSRAASIAEKMQLYDLYKNLIEKGATEATIKVGDKDIKVKRYNTLKEAEADVLRANGANKENLIAIVGERTADRQIKMSDTAADIVKELGYKNGEVDSVMRGMLGVTDNGGLAIGKTDGKVKPVGAKGIQENMVISDIYYQLGYALQRGMEKKLSGSKLEAFAREATQSSNTSMQTSLSAI
jgi:hypothetical protein